MQIGVGLDFTLGLSYEDQAQLAGEAAGMAYASIWTPESNGEDSFQLCALRWAATRDIVPGGLGTGISVSPVGLRTPMGFAMSAGTLSRMTGGRFVLGVGSGGAYMPAYRDTWGLRETSALRLMRDYVTTIRALVSGEAVDYEGASFRLKGASLNLKPAPETPVYLGALGPQMLGLAGEVADGVSLNWCSPDQIAWSREVVAEGADRASRDPSDIVMSEYIRICVDDDVDLARRAFAKAVMGYALGPLDPPRAMSYRAHFERMGFADDLAKIDDLRRQNAPADDVADAFPERLLRHVGYFGPAAGAAEAFKKLSVGLDVAIVRVVAARPSVASTRAVMEACKPALVEAAAV